VLKETCRVWGGNYCNEWTPLFNRWQRLRARMGQSKLSGHQRLYRVRVGDWRILYEIDDAKRIVEIHLVAHRREVYRGL